MSEVFDKPKVISLFSRQPVGPEHTGEVALASTTETKPLPPNLPTPTHDSKSIETLNSVLEAVMQKKCSGVCVIATGPSGLPRFWISMPEGTNPQTEAVRYIGQANMLQSIFEEIAYHGVENVGTDT